MKKVIALVLAVALSLSMASIVFAGDVANLADYSAATSITPGASLKFDVVANFPAPDSTASAIAGDYISGDYFSIKVDYTRGKELVKEVKFDNGNVVVVLKSSIAELPSVANFQIKSIVLTGKKDGITEKYRNKKYTLNNGSVNGAKKVGFTIDSTNFKVGNDFSAPADLVVKMIKNDSGDTYGTSVISFGSVASAEVRLYKDEKFFLEVDTKADLDVVKTNPDADLEFVNFKGTPTFSSNAKVEIYADEDTFLYEIKDGKVVESSFKYDADASAFTGKARTLGKYVISDIKLVNAATTTETKNPDTGANDVVGVAVALAVVSLVAAGAVSLKK